MVWRPERARRHQRPLAVQQPGNAVDLRRFDGFLQTHVREDRREPTRQERFARPRGTYEKNIMGPGGGHLEGALDVLLAFDVSEVFIIDRLLPKQRLHIAQRLWNRLGAVKKANGLRQRRHPKDWYVLNDGRLGSIFRWHDHALQPGLAQR